MLNVANRTLFTGDNLDVMRGINSECIDLIYLDPPFNSNRTYSAPIGSKAAGAKFKDSWTLSDLDVAWHGLIADTHPSLYAIIDSAGVCYNKSMKAYLIMMAVRLLEMKRILKDTGSIFLHCDPTASHYLKMTMDAIFGSANFRNEIIWCYTGPGSPLMRQFNRKHDTILWYSKGSTWTFNGDSVRLPHKGGAPNDGGFKGGSKKITDPEYAAKGKIPETWWIDIAIAPRSRKEYVGYPTQKPLKLLERIIKAASGEGDVVLDPFCGCATACVAAEYLQRNWIGIDIAEKAVDIVHQRLSDETRIFGQITHRLDLAVRNDTPEVCYINNVKTVLYGEQEGRCKGCKVLFPFRNLEVDHITPRSRGGQNHLKNLQLLCGSCNRTKGNRPMEYLTMQLDKIDSQKRTFRVQ